MLMILNYTHVNDSKLYVTNNNINILLLSLNYTYVVVISK